MAAARSVGMEAEVAALRGRFAAGDAGRGVAGGAAPRDPADGGGGGGGGVPRPPRRPRQALHRVLRPRGKSNLSLLPPLSYKIK